jgi:hypothetical protein
MTSDHAYLDEGRGFPVAGKCNEFVLSSEEH